MRKLIAASAVALLGGALLLAPSTTATAAKWITGGDIKNGTVTSADVKDGTVKQRDLGPGVVRKLNTKSTGKQGPQGPKGDRGLRGEKGADGKLVIAFHTTEADGIAPIHTIGGKWVDGATKVGVTGQLVPEGTYLVTATATFAKRHADVSSTTASPVLQFAVRADDGSPWGLDLGTAYTAPFPVGNKGIEQSASSTKVVTLDERLPVQAYAFGYNADRSSAGSGDFEVKTYSVVFTKLS